VAIDFILKSATVFSRRRQAKNCAPVLKRATRHNLQHRQQKIHTDHSVSSPSFSSTQHIQRLCYLIATFISHPFKQSTQPMCSSTNANAPSTGGVLSKKIYNFDLMNAIIRQCTMYYCKAKSFIYDAVILRMTEKWYRTVLQRLPDGAVVLDVGVGTGGTLCICIASSTSSHYYHMLTSFLYLVNRRSIASLCRFGQVKGLEDHWN
jgi:hypothetical protein